MNEHHINPKKIDEQLAAEINSEFFINLDPLGLYLTNEDLKSDSVSVKVTMFQNAGACSWQKTVARLLQRKMHEADKIISTTLSKPLLFADADFIEFVKESEGDRFCKNQVELAKKWKRWLSFEVLSTMYESAHTKGATKPDAKLLMSFEPAARNTVKEKELKKIKEAIKDKIESDVKETLLKSIAKVFDPHSDFFSNTEMKSFEEEISSTESSFGFEIAKNVSDEIYISRIVPGSSAWNSNEVHQGDLLLQVKKKKGEFTTLDSFDDASISLKEWEENEIELKLKKADGRIAYVKLYKEKVESTENRVQGLVLNGQSKIGYVALPSFYFETDDQKEIGGCANDLAKEIIKLKKEGIAGLILDLRFNGGGSVMEAIDIVGLFIDFGPVSLIKTKQQIVTLKDTNRGSIYDGPLVIMVNGASASASEFVAAALQDYNRALIVGTSTYGKGTGQRIFSSDSIKQEFLKITDGKLYRVTGKSNQGKGVQPDIFIPDLTHAFYLREKDKRHALVQDSVVKKVYFTPAAKVDFAAIRQASQNRIEQNPYFKTQDSIAHLYRAPISLKLESYLTHQRNVDLIGARIDQTPISSKYKVAHNQFDNSLLKMDSFRKSLSDELLMKISRSPFIDETYSIIIQYINQLNKTK